MAEIHVRPFVPADLASLAKIDHAYSTDRVWKLDVQRTGTLIQVSLREQRLPRAIQQSAPRDGAQLLTGWKDHWGILVGVEGPDRRAEPAGYISFDHGREPASVHIGELAVAGVSRRRGIAKALLLAAEEWTTQQSCRQIILEIPSKNVPALNLAARMGYDFCGYSDRYFSNRDVALFFGKNI